MLRGVMQHPGHFKILSRKRAFEATLSPELRDEHRVQRIVASLRREIQDEATTVRALRVFKTPHEVFRVEIENPELGYLRTTLFDRSVLDALRNDATIGPLLRVEVD